MVKEFILDTFVLQIISIFILLIIIFKLLRVTKSIKYEKRIGKYSLSPLKEIDKSFFDKVNEITWKFIKNISSVLNKSAVFKKYGDTFEKHITYEDKTHIEGTDYVSIKFLCGIILVMLNFITIMFTYKSINSILLLFTFIIGFFITDIILFVRYKNKRKRIEEDLLKSIIIMNNAFKSGRNIVQAIEIVKDQLDGPISDEFKKILMDITYGLSLEVVFDRFYHRVKLEDARYITSSLTLLNKTGGNIVRVFASIEKSFYNKKKLRDELKSMTASSTFVFRVLTFLPFVLGLIIYILNPTYFVPFISSTLGVLFLLLLIFLLALYVIVVKRVMRVRI